MVSSFAGIFPYLVSPVDPDGTIREGVLRELTAHLIACGVHGLVPLGSTGEFFYLNWAQRREIVRIVVDEARGRVPVVAGVAAASVREGQRQARAMEELGADGVLAMLNVYFPLDQEGIYTYFSQVASAVDCPVVLYHNPKFSGFEMGVDTLVRLAQHPNIEYYKDASPNTGRLLELYSQVGDKLKIFSASAHVPLFVMLLGGKGWMAGPSCVIPRESVQLYELCRAGAWDEAMALQRRLWRLNMVFQQYGLAACIKGALTLQGFDVGGPIPPTKVLSEEAWEEIGSVVREIRGGYEP